jgi:cell division protein FtsB
MLVALRKGFWLFGVATFLLIAFFPGYTKLQELRDRNRDLEDKIRRLHIENSLLEQELSRIENDPIYQEKIAREKMGLVRKGEVPVKILPEQKE